MKPWSHFSLIGVVEDSRNRAIDTAREPAPSFHPASPRQKAAATSLKPPETACSNPNSLHAVWRVDPLIQKVEPIALKQRIESGFASQRLTLFLFLGFGAVALTLAATGLGAAISASVSESTKEIGIRTALGEPRQSIAGRILEAALIRTLIGTVTALPALSPSRALPACALAPNFSIDFTALGGEHRPPCS